MKQVYLLKSSYTGYYKIGVSKNPAKRVKQLQTGTSENIEIIHSFTSEYPYKLECALHNHFTMYKVNREWYNLPIESHFDFIEICNRFEKNIILIMKNNENI